MFIRFFSKLWLKIDLGTSYCSKGSLWSSYTLAISLVLEIANINNIMLPGFPFLGPRLLGYGFSNFKMFQVSRVSQATQVQAL